MNRKQFLSTLIAALPATLYAMETTDRHHIEPEHTTKMPVLFLGHGSPMNALANNTFTQGFQNVVADIQTPRAILCISAHWETRGTQVTAMQNPRTIHDFGGFPQALFDVQYPAPGSPELAAETKKLITSSSVQLDQSWGLDHGTWSVLIHLFPKANIPIVQLSLDINKTPQQHYDLARELASLREKGVLIVASGNLVHNLRMVDWRRVNENFAFDWAQEASHKMNQFILNQQHNELIQYNQHGRAFALSIPTPEHYIPLLYTLALQNKTDTVSLFNDLPVGGSLSMTSVLIR